jgi:hypothetical protein
VLLAGQAAYLASERVEGTGALRRLRGEAAFVHDDSGARLTLSYTLPAS